MSRSIVKKSAFTAVKLFVISHIPHILLFIGLEAMPIILWVGLIENLPLYFIDLTSSSHFKIGEFGISSYDATGLMISLAIKCVFFLILSFAWSAISSKSILIK